MSELEEISGLLVDCFKAGNKVLILGVGGNAANAIHFTAELSGKYERYTNPLPCVCLSENPSVLTAITNDFGWEHVFERQISALAKPGDVVIAFSISTKGSYLVNAINEALRQYCLTVLICGRNTTFLTATALLRVWELNSDDTPWVQEEQLRIVHQICGEAKKLLS